MRVYLPRLLLLVACLALIGMTFSAVTSAHAKSLTKSKSAHQTVQFDVDPTAAATSAEEDHDVDMTADDEPAFDDEVENENDDSVDEVDSTPPASSDDSAPSTPASTDPVPTPSTEVLSSSPSPPASTDSTSTPAPSNPAPTTGNSSSTSSSTNSTSSPSSSPSPSPDVQHTSTPGQNESNGPRPGRGQSVDDRGHGPRPGQGQDNDNGHGHGPRPGQGQDDDDDDDDDDHGHGHGHGPKPGQGQGHGPKPGEGQNGGHGHGHGHGSGGVVVHDRCDDMDDGNYFPSPRDVSCPTKGGMVVNGCQAARNATAEARQKVIKAIRTLLSRSTDQKNIEKRLFKLAQAIVKFILAADREGVVCGDGLVIACDRCASRRRSQSSIIRSEVAAFVQAFTQVNSKGTAVSSAVCEAGLMRFFTLTHSHCQPDLIEVRLCPEFVFEVNSCPDALQELRQAEKKLMESIQQLAKAIFSHKNVKEAILAYEEAIIKKTFASFLVERFCFDSSADSDEDCEYDDTPRGKCPSPFCPDDCKCRQPGQGQQSSSSSSSGHHHPDGPGASSGAGEQSSSSSSGSHHTSSGPGELSSSGPSAPGGGHDHGGPSGTDGSNNGVVVNGANVASTTSHAIMGATMVAIGAVLLQ